MTLKVYTPRAREPRRGVRTFSRPLRGPEIFSMKIFTKGKKKGAMEIYQLVGWILAVVILAIMVVAYFILKSKGIDAIEYVKNILRFRK